MVRSLKLTHIALVLILALFLILILALILTVVLVFALILVIGLLVLLLIVKAPTLAHTRNLFEARTAGEVRVEAVTTCLDPKGGDRIVEDSEDDLTEDVGEVSVGYNGNKEQSGEVEVEVKAVTTHLDPEGGNRIVEEDTARPLEHDMPVEYDDEDKLAANEDMGNWKIDPRVENRKVEGVGEGANVWEWDRGDTDSEESWYSDYQGYEDNEQGVYDGGDEVETRNED